MISKKSARVFLVDDHPIVRMGFGRLLESSADLSVCGEAGSGEEALEKIGQSKADLAVVDISMDGMDGIELTKRLLADYPDMRVMIVSMHDDVHYVERAFDAGATGYVLKDKVDELIAEAAQDVLAGKPYICPELKDKLN